MFLWRVRIQGEDFTNVANEDTDDPDDPADHDDNDDNDDGVWNMINRNTQWASYSLAINYFVFLINMFLCCIFVFTFSVFPTSELGRSYSQT